MQKVNLEMTKEEALTVEKALRLLRDRHYSNYYNAKDQYSETALKQLRIYEELEELRNRFRSEAWAVTRTETTAVN
jgi:hypothetical protein